MTFSEIQTAVADYCIQTSGPALVRIGNAINRHYRRITASIGLDPARFVTRSQTTTNGVGTVTFTSIEKIDRVVDATTASAIVLLKEVSVHELRSTQPGTSAPQRWAFLNSDADSVTILLDTLPQSTFSLRADGWTTLSDLTANDEPAFPESYHDILVWYVISEELLKKEKDKLALTYQVKADTLLKELRFFLADSHTRDTVQASSGTLPALGSAGGSGSGSSGGTAYTQSALITFDLGASTAPFAVAQSSAPYVANLGAEFLGNVSTDRLIGRDTAATGESEQLTVTGGVEFTGAGGIQRSAISGDVTIAAGSTVAAVTAGAIVDADINATAAITWTKVSKTGSALSDLMTRSASSLNAGTVPDAQLAGAVFQAADGSVGTPSHGFSSDTDSGWYRVGANNIAAATGGTKALEITSAGVIHAPLQLRAVAYHSTTQAVASTTAALVLDSEDLDVGTLHSTSSNTSRMTIPTGGDGLYLVTGQALVSSAATDTVLNIRKNGATLSAAGYTQLTSTLVLRVEAVLALVATDYVELVAITAGGSGTFGSATRQYATTLNIVKLA